MYCISFRHWKMDSVEGPCYEGLEYVNWKFVHDLTGKYLLYEHISDPNDALYMYIKSR